jgi:hypothetical protein
VSWDRPSPQGYVQKTEHTWPRGLIQYVIVLSGTLNNKKISWRKRQIRPQEILLSTKDSYTSIRDLHQMNFIRENINVFPYFYFRLIRYSRVCSPLRPVFISRHVTDKQVDGAGVLFPLESALRTLYGHYNDLVCHYQPPIR